MAEKKKDDSVLSKAKRLYQAGKKKFKELTSPIKSKMPGGATINRGQRKQLEGVEGKNTPSNPKLKQKMKNVRVVASTPKNNVYGA